MQKCEECHPNVEAILGLTEARHARIGLDPERQLRSARQRMQHDAPGFIRARTPSSTA